MLKNGEVVEARVEVESWSSLAWQSGSFTTSSYPTRLHHINRTRYHNQVHARPFQTPLFDELSVVRKMGESRP